MEACPMSAHNVTVYSTPTCPYCKRVKHFLDERGIRYQDIDVASDKTARDEMVKKSGRMAVPVVEIDGVVTVGFDETALRKQLEL
jgi:glutaredoxin-like YruB-family protein